MILFHGSNTVIDVVDLAKSKRYKDFGQAFYLSAEEDQARKMAVAKVVQYGGEESITLFEFDESSLFSPDLQVMCFEEYSRTYQNLLNPLSQLYYQSPGYVYLCLCAENETNI